jgi:hypothetical protein
MESLCLTIRTKISFFFFGKINQTSSISGYELFFYKSHNVSFHYPNHHKAIKSFLPELVTTSNLFVIIVSLISYYFFFILILIFGCFFKYSQDLYHYHHIILITVFKSFSLNFFQLFACESCLSWPM